MSASATLQHEDIFERHLLGLIGGGFAAGTVTTVLELVVGREVMALGALSFAAVVGLVINQLDPREDTALMRLMLALMGGVLMGGLAGMGLAGFSLVPAMVGGGFIGAALTFDRPQTRGRKLLTWLLFAAALPAGVFTANTLFDTGFLKPLDIMLVRESIVGTTWGLFLAVAAGLSDLRFESDAVVGRIDEAVSRHQEPVRDYLESARELYRQILRECERSEEDDTRLRAREIGVETIDSLLRIAERFRELDQTISRSGADRLRRRIQRLDARLDAAADASVANEIEQAKQEAFQQLQMRQRLELACARLESRLQRSVTTLEKLHLTLVQHATSAANDVGLGESLARLEQLVDEVEFKNLSVDELCQMDELADQAPTQPEQGGEAESGAGAESVDQPVEPVASEAHGWDGALDASPVEPDADAEEANPGAEPADHHERDHEPVVCEHDSTC